MATKNPRVREGFTLIELTLSIVFIGILSLAVVLIISNTIASYRRGLTLNQINTVGMDLVDDMRSALQNSTMKSVKAECEKNFTGDEKTECNKNGGKNFVNYIKTGNVNVNGVKKDMPIYGALCTGSYSYIWNSGYHWASGEFDGRIASAKVSYTYNDTSNNSNTSKILGEFRLIKIEDTSRSICTSTMLSSDDKLTSYSNAEFSGTFKAGEVTKEPIELLSTSEDSDSRLALYDLSSSIPAESSTGNSVFYSISFILGTVDGGIDIMAKGSSCSAPNSASGDYFNYCAINKFNFAAQAGGE